MRYSLDVCQGSGAGFYTKKKAAFIQQRQKINKFAFPALFDLFAKQTDTVNFKTYTNSIRDKKQRENPLETAYIRDLSLLHEDSEEWERVSRH